MSLTPEGNILLVVHRVSVNAEVDEAEDVDEEGDDVEEQLRDVHLVGGVPRVVDPRGVDLVLARGVAVHVPADKREVEERLHPVPPQEEHPEQGPLDGVLWHNQRLEAAREICGGEVDVEVTV